MPRLPRTDLDVAEAGPASGAPMVDTAEAYGNGRSEQILGAWLADRGMRDRVVVATKASARTTDGPEDHPLSAKEIAAAAERSLTNLRTDRIDVYYAHVDDGTTPRPVYEDALRDVVAEAELACFPYFVLARGFLTGKYRRGGGGRGAERGERIDSPRAEGAERYLGERGDRVLDALGEVADAHGVTRAAVALRWPAGRPADRDRADRQRSLGRAACRAAPDARPGADRRRADPTGRRLGLIRAVRPGGRRASM